MLYSVVSHQLLYSINVYYVYYSMTFILLFKHNSDGDQYILQWNASYKGILYADGVELAQTSTPPSGENVTTRIPCGTNLVSFELIATQDEDTTIPMTTTKPGMCVLIFYRNYFGTNYI